MWYKDWFADEHYLALYEHRNQAEAGKLLDLIQEAVEPAQEARILDLACGAGRHSIAFAKRGFTKVTGMDLSPTLIAKARESATAEQVSVTFVNSDMRELTGEYDLILNLFTSFGYFENDAENEAVIAHVAASLAPGGHFVIDFLNAFLVSKSLVPHSHSTLDCGEPVDQYREIVRGRVNKRIVIKTTEQVKEFRESVRLFTKNELRAMIARHGMEVEEVFGDYDGGEFAEGSSPRVIIVAKKDG
jgi:2-polyprenyl-3-methyl-5-hydroxy-6-metoxy-1,4-benzoquinol methylase